MCCVVCSLSDSCQLVECLPINLTAVKQEENFQYFDFFLTVQKWDTIEQARSARAQKDADAGVIPLRRRPLVPAPTWLIHQREVELDWKTKLLEAFPSKHDFCKQLRNMLARNKLPHESYQRYYYEKVALLNGCKIQGTDAVSCIIGGLTWLQCKSGRKGREPPIAWVCLWVSVFTGGWRWPNPFWYHTGATFCTQLPTGTRIQTCRKKNTTENYSQSVRRFGSSDPQFNQHATCYACGEVGHVRKNCVKTIRGEVATRRCQKCGTAHIDGDCPRIRDGPSTSKTIAWLATIDEPLSSNKYYKKITINGHPSTAFVDLGSSCITITSEEASRLDITYDSTKQVGMRGYGGGTVVSLRSAQLRIKVDNVELVVEATVVPPLVEEVPVILGHQFTESSGIIVLKDENKLTFYKRFQEAKATRTGKISLWPIHDVIVPPFHFANVEVETRISHEGDLYIGAAVRHQVGREHSIPGTVIHFQGGQSTRLPVINLSDNELILKFSQLIARAWPCSEEVETSERLMRVSTKQSTRGRTKNRFSGWPPRETVTATLTTISRLFCCRYSGTRVCWFGSTVHNFGG